MVSSQVQEETPFLFLGQNCSWVHFVYLDLSFSCTFIYRELEEERGDSLAGQWLRLPLQGRGVGSIPGQGAKIPHAMREKTKT